MSNKMTNSELAQTLKALARATSKASALRAKISDHSMEVYGVDPGDVDCDQFIDSCEVGNCGGMTAAEFDRAMKQSIG